jgi:hypothetical protein
MGNQVLRISKLGVRGALYFTLRPGVYYNVKRYKGGNKHDIRFKNNLKNN